MSMQVALERIEKVKANGVDELDLSGLSLSSLPEQVFQLQNLKSLDLRFNVGIQLSMDKQAFPCLEGLNLDMCGLSEVPESVYEMSNLKRLSLQNNELSKISGKIDCLKKLEVLILSENRIEGFPVSVCDLEKLIALELRGNALGFIPDDIGTMTSLKALNVERCGLSELPDSLFTLSELRRLEARGNKLDGVPSIIGNLVKLEELSLGNNKISYLPESFCQLKELIELDLSDNTFSVFPTEIVPLEGLNYLSFRNNQLEDLSPGIDRLENLSILNLSGNVLHELPLEVCLLDKIRELYLSGNFLNVLPVEMSALTAMKILDISENKFVDFPNVVYGLDNLEVLEAGGNRFEAVSADVGRLMNLKRLSLYDNNLREVSCEIEKLKNLTFLDLSKNDLKRLPSGVYGLADLKILIIGSNGLTELPVEICDLRGLEYLDIGDCLLPSIPVEISYLENMRFLNLRRNELTNVPVGVCGLRNLVELDLSYNKLTNLSAEFSKLQSLESLDLSGNKLTNLSAGFSNLKKLKSLRLNDNQMTLFPSEVFELERLVVLDLQSNQFVEISSEIKGGDSLRWLFLASNQIRKFPVEICRLKNLYELRLEGNAIAQLPIEIKQMENLNVLGLRDNLFEIPEEVYEQSASELISYILALQVEKRPLHEAKLILVGNGNVGKTSLVKRLLHDQFDENEATTHGINIEDWSLKRGEDDILLHVWDFGGQQIMHATHKFFMTKRSIYVLVVEPRTEDQQGDTPLDYWLTLVRSYAENSPVVIVTNKCDGGISSDVAVRDYMFRYPQIVGFVEVSCKESAGIKELKKRIQKAMEDLPHLNDQVPLSYLHIKKRLEDENNDFITFREYEEICFEVDEDIDKNAKAGLVRLLNDLGVMLNISDNRRLQDTQVLNPEWLTNGVYQIVTSQTLRRKQGCLSFDDVVDILEHQDLGRQYEGVSPKNIVLDMMEHFKLCYKIKDHERYLIPSALPKDRPDNLQWEPRSSLKFELHYGTLPIAIMSTFIVSVMEFAKGESYWRNGIIIEYENNWVLIWADVTNNIIYIEVDGEAFRRHALSFVRAQFKVIHKQYSDVIDARECVPLFAGDKKAFINYQDLLYYEEMGELNPLYPPLRERIDVKKILEGVEASRQGSGHSLLDFVTKGGVYPFDSSEGQRLHQILKETYNGVSSLVSLVERVGIQKGDLHLLQAPTYIWRDIIELAGKRRCLRLLLREVLGDKSAAARHDEIRSLLGLGPGEFPGL